MGDKREIEKLRKEFHVIVSKVAKEGKVSQSKVSLDILNIEFDWFNY